MKLRTLVASAVMALAGSTAMAQSIPLTFNSTGPNTQVASFQQDAFGFVLDTFSFTPASFAGNVAVSLMSLSGPVSFQVATLNDVGFGVGPNDDPTTFSFQSVVSASQPLTLQLLGFSGSLGDLTPAAGRYAGTITATSVAAIPEPETYALMLAGLAALGAVARRRRAGTARR